ncbi:hypothetical protein C8J57DRAFT_1548307 [Mycena rebaudengoi]|nr:hypothetical protein C8J57DRAFT_1548307 [Mycena rebaudengoi]
MYYDYYDQQPAYYDDDPEYYQPEPESDDGYDAQFDEDVYDGAGMDCYQDYGEAGSADMLAYADVADAGEIVEFGEYDHHELDGDSRYAPPYNSDSDPSIDEHGGVYDPEDAPLILDLAHATDAEINAVAWAAVFSQGPPADSSPDEWCNAMDAWRLRILAGTDADAGASVEEVVDPLQSPAQSWIAPKLEELYDALQRGEIDSERYEQAHSEWLEDEAEDQRLQAEGWAYDEERGDYWHPVHGWGEAYDPEESLEPLSPLPHLSADVDIVPSDSYTEFVPDEPVCIVLTPPAHTYQKTTKLSSPPRTARFSLPRNMHTSSYPPRPTKHPTHRPRAERSSSVRPPAKNRHRTTRCMRSCPELRREPPPHLHRSTSSPPAAEPVKPPDDPTPRTERAVVVRKADEDTSVPANPVPSTAVLSKSSAAGSKSEAHPSWSTRVPAIAGVATLPIPPDIPSMSASAALSAERRRNAQRRLARKRKS